jgi:hypothetical protein
MAKNKTNSGNPKLYSMLSKLLWFYHPTQMTMYDRYAVDALGLVKNCKITPETFLAVFDDLFHEKLPSINTAAVFSDREYPYPRRVLDKWLWLKGSGKEEERLKRFRWSLQRSPIRLAPVA